jgi:hypothetical protein
MIADVTTSFENSVFVAGTGHCPVPATHTLVAHLKKQISPAAKA